MSDTGAGTSYTVELNYRKNGNLAEAFEKPLTKAQSLDKHIGAIKTGLSDLGSVGNTVVGVFDNLAGKAAGLAKVGGFVAGTGLVAGMTYGVTQLNAELEKAKVGLATMLMVRGAATNMPTGIAIAGEQISKMRQDAAKLPGEFQDLFGIYMTGATAALRVASPDKWRELAGNAMAAGVSTMMPLDQVGRELTQLMEGHAGSHNVFGGRLGFTGAKAKELNAADETKRFEMISKELNQFQASIDYFGTTFDANASSAVDYLKQAGQAATEPLFNRVKDGLAEFNEWFTDNKPKIISWANHFGFRLAEAFDWGKRKFQEYAPLVLNFADTAYNRFTAAWEKIEPVAKQFEKAVKSALEDPNGTIDKLLKLGELYLAIKGGQMVIQGGIGAANLASSLGGAMNGAIALSGWAGAGGLTATGGAAAGGAGAAGVGGTSALATLGIGAATAGAALAVLAVDVWAFKKLFDAIEVNEASKDHQQKAFADEADKTIQKFVAAGLSGEALRTSVLNVSHSLYDSANAARGFTSASEGGMSATYELAAAHLEVKLAAYEAAHALERVGGFQEQLMQRISEQATDDNIAYATQQLRDTYFNGHGRDTLDDAAKAIKKSAHTGKSGSTVQKVEIVVTSNQDPSRIAREVRTEFEKKIWHLTASPDVPNYEGDG